MSLINDMLKDLDCRRVRRNPANDAALLGLGLTGNTGPATQKYLAIVIAASLLILLAIFAWPYITSAFMQANPTAVIIDNSAQVAREELLIEQPAAQESASRPPPARTPRTTGSPEKMVQAAASVVYTQPADERHMEVQEPAVQAVKHVTRSRGIVVHQPSLQERVKHTYKKAVQALRSGKSSEAEQLLDQALKLDSKHNETRLLLASLHVRQQRNDEAETLLENGLAQNPGHAPFAKLYAQLLVTKARYREAIQYLQTALPGAGRDAEYHALLAGLYQRTGKAAEAAQQYQLALRLTPAKGEWWMGLGISLEQSGNQANAHAAYQRALHYPLSTPLQQYINTRIKNLPRQQDQG